VLRILRSLTLRGDFASVCVRSLLSCCVNCRCCSLCFAIKLVLRACSLVFNAVAVLLQSCSSLTRFQRRGERAAKCSGCLPKWLIVRSRCPKAQCTALSAKENLMHCSEHAFKRYVQAQQKFGGVSKFGVTGCSSVQQQMPMWCW
jgi:hypothetical protein